MSTFKRALYNFLMLVGALILIFAAGQFQAWCEKHQWYWDYVV